MYSEELNHHGIKGMKWGVRRYANADGTLTPEGKKRYGVDSVSAWKTKKQDMRKERERLNKQADERFGISNKKASYEGTKEVSDVLNEMFGVNVSKLADYKESRYREAHQNGQDYVEKKMRKKFGVSYDRMVTDEAFTSVIASGITALGLIGASMYVQRRTK